MKVIGIAVGLAAFLAAGVANAGTIIYDTIGSGASPTDGGSYPLLPNGVLTGPAGDSFTVTTPTQLQTVTLRLSDSTPSDGGSVLVFLVPTDPARNAPWTNGTNASTALTNAQPLGTIPDSKLSAGLTNIPLPTTAFIGSGTWWIVAEATGDSDAAWEYNFRSGAGLGNLTGGLGTAGQFVTWQNAMGGLAANNLANTVGPVELTITTPEPTSLALLGAGLVGLGCRRRRRNKTQAE